MAEPVWRARLRRALDSENWNMKALSLAAGLGETYVRDALKRDRTPGIDKLNALAEALGVPLSELTGDDAEPAPSRQGRVMRVPVLEWVQAGKLADGHSQIPVESVPLLAFADLGRGEFFALRVQGDSMDRVSPDDSVIIVNRKEQTPISGQYYVFFVKGEGTTYKRWHAGPPSYLGPFSTNPVHQPIFRRRSEIQVIGRVRRTVLDL